LHRELFQVPAPEHELEHHASGSISFSCIMHQGSLASGAVPGS
jgi:hypothetical protein